MDEQYAENISAEENKKIELENIARKQTQERDEMAFKIITDFPSMDYRVAYNMLKDQNWNYQAVHNDLNAQQRLQEQKEEQNNQKIMQVAQACPDLYDFDQIKKSLIANNWNVEKVIQIEKQRNQIDLILKNCTNQNDQFFMLLPKNSGVTGMAIIEHIVRNKPIAGPGAGPNSAYNIYRDQAKQTCINYIELSNTVENLNLDALPSDHMGKRILYFNLDSEMKYD